jgi:hypothetical protein
LPLKVQRLLHLWNTNLIIYYIRAGLELIKHLHACPVWGDARAVLYNHCMCMPLNSHYLPLATKDMNVLVLSLVLALVCTQGYAFDAIAAFNTRGVTGWIGFTRTADNTATEIMVRLDGLDASVPWSIHQLPVLTTLEPSQRGLDENVGPVYDSPTRETGETTCSMELPTNCLVGDLSGR